MAVCEAFCGMASDSIEIEKNMTIITYAKLTILIEDDSFSILLVCEYDKRLADKQRTEVRTNDEKFHIFGCPAFTNSARSNSTYEPTAGDIL
ncbi:hypothetical protein TNIN_43201 [Trichonephila inaurata madagascariensis]|uniref:Uncharacterized protein n=1 Tax=Trichonephila inaurata madagascariensis TaxID=2747483 RepID=A0A8X6Y7K3_9ARAC|nr:hypothetical protein TNIN_43201 [Trichonephila inaurata madagascariensis]